MAETGGKCPLVFSVNPVGRIASLWPLHTKRSFGMISFRTGRDDELVYYTILENTVVYMHFSDWILLILIISDMFYKQISSIGKVCRDTLYRMF